MNKKCCVCEKEFRPPPGKEGIGLISDGDHFLETGQEFEFYWRVEIKSGCLCPKCAFAIMHSVLRAGEPDIDGLLAGRKYDKVIDPEDTTDKEYK